MSALSIASRLASAVAAVVMLTGCVATENPNTEPPIRDATSTPVSTPAPTSPTPIGPDPELVGIPLDIDCLDVISLEALYDFNPNFGSSTTIEMSPRTERVLGFEGIACGWTNQSSGDSITTAVARFSASDLSVIRAESEAVQRPEIVMDSAVFFWRNADVGSLEAFARDYWIVIESSTFSDQSDALPLLDAIVASLP